MYTTLPPRLPNCLQQTVTHWVREHSTLLLSHPYGCAAGPHCPLSGALQVAGVTTELAEPFFDILNGLFWAWQLAIQRNAVHS